MLRLEDFMEIQKLHHDGLSVSEIARQLDLDRKTVRSTYSKRRGLMNGRRRAGRVDPFRSYLRERWGAGCSQRGAAVCRDPEVQLWRLRDAGEEGGAIVPERWPGARLVRFETAPGEEAQMDWGMATIRYKMGI